MVGRKRKAPLNEPLSIDDNVVAKCSKADSRSINSLPCELFLRIIRYLDCSSVLRCRDVCERWRNIIDEAVLFWKRHAEEQGVSIIGLPERLDGNSSLIVNAIRKRLENFRLLDGAEAVLKYDSPLVGIQNDEGVLINWHGKLLFYRLRGIRLHRFLDSLHENFDFDEYAKELVFSLEFDGRVLDWCAVDGRIHIFNGDTIQSWEFGDPPKQISSETLYKTKLLAESLSIYRFPENIRVVKLSGKNRICAGVSISFKLDSGGYERIFIASRDTKTCIFHANSLFQTEEIFTLQYSFRDCGIHFMKGPSDKSIVVCMGSVIDDDQDTYLEIQSFLIAVDPKGSVSVVRISLLQLACDSSSNEIARIGSKFVVLFDRDRKRLRYYRRPEADTPGILQPKFEIKIPESSDAFDWSQAKFVFQDDVNEGMFASEGLVKLYKCQQGSFAGFFYVHCI